MSTTTLTGKVPFDTAHEQANNSGFVADPTPALNANSSASSILRYTALMRFTDLRVPRGAQINSAIMRVTPQNTSNDDPELDIQCEDIANAQSVVDLASIFTERTARLTTAKATWSATGLGVSEVSSPDFKTAVQELVDRTDYEITSAIAILFTGLSAITGAFRVLSGEIFLDLAYDLLSAQNALAITSTTGVPFAFDREVSEVTVQCDAGSSVPVLFKVPGAVNDWFELAAGKSISVFAPPKVDRQRSLGEILFKVASSTATASYVTSGA